MTSAAHREQAKTNVDDFYRRTFARRDIIGRDGSVYLTRWKIGPFLLHCIRQPDEDRCHHDHPWWFISLVLRGGYREEISDSNGGVVKRWHPPGTVVARGATHTHRIVELPNGPAWTLLLHGPRERSWGFVSRGTYGARVWTHWRDYLAAGTERCA